jgi:hypothetical protein
MRKQNLMTTAGVFAMMALFAASGSAQDASARFGKWKIKSDAPPPTSNIMTYSPLPDHGMKIDIVAVSKDGSKKEWGYTTHFDGKDEKFFGDSTTDTGSIRMLSPTVNEITYKKGGKVIQVLENVLSADGKTIGVLYMNYGPDGKVTRITTATYEKIE